MGWASVVMMALYLMLISSWTPMPAAELTLNSISGSATYMAGSDGTASDPQTALNRLVFFTEDVDRLTPGCDAISVFDINGEAIHLGATRVSPGRLAAASDLSFVLASRSNGMWKSGFSNDFSDLVGIYALYRNPSKPATWIDTYLDGQEEVSEVGGIAVTNDLRYLLVATQRDNPTLSCRAQPFSVSRYDVAEIDFANSTLGPERARIVLDAPVAEIVLSDQGRVAHLVLVPFDATTPDATAVVSIDVDSMTEIAPRVPIASIGAVYDNCGGTTSYTHAALSLDERYLVVNRWERAQISIVDLVARRAVVRDIRLPGARNVGGIAFNWADENHGLLAVHGGDVVGVFRWNATDAPSLLAWAAGVDFPPVIRRQGPGASIAWSGDGSTVIAATSKSGQREFRAWRVTDQGRKLTRAADYTVCEVDEFNLPNDILTGNGVLPTAPAALTPTAWPIPSATSTPASTLPSSPTPSPTPTSSPTASSTATTTPSATTTATATPATPSPTATPTTHRVFLPIVSTAPPCPVRHLHADVVLVLDASSSMTGAKLAAAKGAALAFIDALQLPNDQVGVVAFSQTATLLSPLTGDAGALGVAISALAPSPGTRIDAGLSAAWEELRGDRRRPGNAPVLIVLTDGRQAEAPEAAQAVAAAARAAGVTIYSIGLGADVDALYLVDLAASPSRYFFAPDGDALAGIYRDIALLVPCN
jgi:uncharacterized protein YegL